MAGKAINYERRRIYDRMRDAGTEQDDIRTSGRAMGRLPVPVVVAQLQRLGQGYRRHGERATLARIKFLYHDLQDRGHRLDALGVTPEQLGIALAWQLYRRGRI